MSMIIERKKRRKIKNKYCEEGEGEEKEKENVSMEYDKCI